MIADAMRRTRRALIVSLSAMLPLAMAPIAALAPLTALAQAAPASKAPAVCATPSAPIIDEGFVNIGGIDQWVTIHGARCDNPVILFVHGGPGNALSPYSKAIYGAWEKDFTIVHWDQRGAGQTFLRNPGTADTTLSMEQLAADGVAVAGYVTRHLRQPKVILLGGSWGSALGVTMAQLKPELFSAYVGIGQMVNYREGIIASYNKTLGLARAAGDAETVSKLEALGTPPWTNPRNSGVLRRATRVYEAKTALPAPKAWWTPEAQYATPQYEAAAEAADDYSYVQFVGMTGKGMASLLDLPALGLTFQMPVYIFAGDADLVTVPELARRYFDRITAPHKEFIPVPHAGHDPNVSLVDAEFALLSRQFGHAAQAAASTRAESAPQREPARLSAEQTAILTRQFGSFKVVSTCGGNFSGNSNSEMVLGLAVQRAGTTTAPELTRVGLVLVNGRWTAHHIDDELKLDEAISNSHPSHWEHTVEKNAIKAELKCRVALHTVADFTDGAKLLGRKPFFAMAKAAGNANVCYPTSSEYNNWDCVAYNQKKNRFGLWYQQVFSD